MEFPFLIGTSVHQIKTSPVSSFNLNYLLKSHVFMYSYVVARANVNEWQHNGHLHSRNFCTINLGQKMFSRA